MNLNPRPWMTDAEVDFLAKHIRLTDTVFEYGGGGSTLWLAPRCRWLTAVEHARNVAMSLVTLIPENVQVIYAPPDLPYVEGTDEDGDMSTFDRYVTSYTGKRVDVVIIDGRARVECLRHVAETAQYGPHPEMKVFVHDAPRYEQAWKKDKAKWREVERVDSLVRLEAVF